MTITDLLKSILKGLTEFLNRPVTEISKDYDLGGYVMFYTHSSFFYLPLQTFYSKTFPLNINIHITTHNQ